MAMQTKSRPVVLVTGASGFVGSALCSQLTATGYAVRGTRRCALPSNIADTASSITIPDIGPATAWSEALRGVTTVVHLAARVHVMHDTADEPLAAFRAVNTAGTVNLARQAAAAGVRRFIYVSTIKVNGESTAGRPFCAEDHPHPEDVYAQSKLEAELALKSISQDIGLEIVIVRPPLVYGPGVKGNFLAMLRVLQKGWPLPLASCDNQRSFIGLTNFVSLLEKCVSHPAAAGQVFLAADGDDLSTPELLRRVAHALGRKVRCCHFLQFCCISRQELLGARESTNACAVRCRSTLARRASCSAGHRRLPWTRNWRARQAGIWP